MKKFVLIYYSDMDSEDMTEEQKKETMTKWMAWFDSIKDKIADKGNPFNSGGMAVMASGVKEIPADMWPAKGYTIINAQDMDEAIEITKGCPAIVDNEKDATIRVYETMPM